MQTVKLIHYWSTLWFYSSTLSFKVLPRFSWHFNWVVLTFALSRIHPVTFFWSLSLMTVSSFWPLSSCPLPTTHSHHQAVVYCMYILRSLLGNNHLLFHLPTLTCTDTNPISFSKSLEDILTKKNGFCASYADAHTQASVPQDHALPDKPSHSDYWTMPWTRWHFIMHCTAMAVATIEGCGLSARDENPDTHIGIGVCITAAMGFVPAKTVPNQYCPNVYQELYCQSHLVH